MPYLAGPNEEDEDGSHHLLSKGDISNPKGEWYMKSNKKPSQ